MKCEYYERCRKETDLSMRFADEVCLEVPKEIKAHDYCILYQHFEELKLKQKAQDILMRRNLNCWEET